MCEEMKTEKEESHQIEWEGFDNLLCVRPNEEVFLHRIDKFLIKLNNKTKQKQF
jgi:hypothetical protein